MIWSSTTDMNLRKLQVAQNKAARVVLGCPFRTSVRELNTRLAWLSVKSRLNYSIVNFVRKIIVTKMPVILHSRLSPFSTVHHYSTRQSTGSHFLLPLCRTNFGQKMVLYRAMVAWNSLPQF